MNIVNKVGISSILLATCVLSAFALTGCFTAFAPPSDPCTSNPKDTSVRLCDPEQTRKMYESERLRRQSLKSQNAVD
jgi:hypothetical protein